MKKKIVIILEIQDESSATGTKTRQFLYDDDNDEAPKFLVALSSNIWNEWL